MKALSLRGLASPLVAVLAMLPGFALPFVLSAVVGQQASDPFFLAISVALVLSNVLGNTIELNSVVQFGRALSRTGTISRSELRGYRRKIRIFAMIATLIAGPLLIFVYFSTLDPGQRAEFAVVAAISLAVPLLGGEASSRSGHLMACKKQEIAILLQSMRSVFPLLLVISWPTVELPLVAASMVLGEVVRLVVLNVLTARLMIAPRGAAAPLATRGLVTQSLSTSAAQFGPVADRMFLSSAPAGSVTAYELADKVFFAGVQFLNLSFLVNHVRVWSQLRAVEAAVGIRQLKGDLVRLLLFSGSASVLAILVIQFAPLAVSVPADWKLGLFWAQLQLLSLPMSLVSMACSRLLVVADRQNLLLWFAASMTLATVVLDFVAFNALGPVGIPIAGVCVRTLSAVVQVIVTWRYLVPVIGTDVMQSKSHDHSVTW